jgi:hypothetical protein
MNQYRKSRKLSPQYRENFETDEDYEGYDEEDFYFPNYPAWSYTMWEMYKEKYKEDYKENYPHPRVRRSDLNRPCDWRNYPAVGAPPGYFCAAASGPIHRAWRNDLPPPNYFGSLQNAPFRHLPPNYKITKDGVVIRYPDKGFRKGKLIGVG